MQTKIVNTRRRVKDFLKVPFIINKGDPNWIPPLNKDIEKVFKKDKNPLYREGDAVRWVLYEQNKPVGRVAAFIHPKLLNKEEGKTGGMGFFECVNDQSMADHLFQKCEEWLAEREIEKVEGPINFGEKDRFWGLLVDGFYPPTYGMNYNPPYYQTLFEHYGFETYYRQFTYYRKVQRPLEEKYREKAERLAANKDYTFGHIDKKRLTHYAEQFRHVYNRAWSERPGFKPMKEEQAMSIMKSLKPVLVDDLVWFGYYKDEPVGFFIMMPELNQIFRYFNGKFGLWEKLRFKWHEWRQTCRKMFGLVFGVDPDHRGIGLEGAMITAAGNHLQPQNRWDDLELTWIGDFNPKMLHIVESLGTEHIKTHITFRKSI